MATAIKQHQMFVGGEWVDSTAGERLPVVNPATGEVIAEIPRGSEEDVDRAVKAAQKAFDDLDAPVRRVAALDTPVPFARALEEVTSPRGRLVTTLRDLLAY